MQRFFYMLALFSVFTIGCGNTVVITGTAKMADGTKIERGMVSFFGENDMYTATIRPDGTFSPGVMRDGGGIPPGVYRISVSGIFREVMVPGSEHPNHVSLIAERYANRETSGLAIDTSQTRTIDLVLDPAE